MKKLLTEDHGCRQKTGDRVSVSHSMYCAAILVIVFNRIFKHMTKPVALSFDVLPEGIKWRETPSGMTALFTPVTWKRHSSTLRYISKKQTKKLWSTETPKTSVLGHLSLETLKVGLVNLYVLKRFWQSIGSPVICHWVWVCEMLTHKSWRRKDSILGALGKTYRDVFHFENLPNSLLNSN